MSKHVGRKMTPISFDQHFSTALPPQKCRESDFRLVDVDPFN